MKVMKFGGTSVGSVNSILTIKSIVASLNEPVIVVVSAVGGITNQLIKTMNLASSENVEYQQQFQAIRKRHEDLLLGLFSDKLLDAVQFEVNQMLDELGNILKGIFLIQDCSSKTADSLLAYGERISSYFVAKLLNAAHVDARELIKTDDVYGKHIVNFKET